MKKMDKYLRKIETYTNKHPWISFFIVSIFLHISVYLLWPRKNVGATDLSMPAHVIYLMNLDVQYPELKKELKVDDKLLEITKMNEEKLVKEMKRKEKGKTYIPSFEADSKPQPLIDISSIMDYPETARQSGIQGVVLLELDIDEFGRIQRAKIIRSAGWGFDEEVLRKIKLVRFRPALKDKKPVAVTVHLPVEFRLN